MTPEPGTTNSATLYQNAWKLLGYLVLFVVLFVGFALWLRQPDVKVSDRFWCWLGICLLGFVIVFFGAMLLLPKRCYLLLTPEGFTVSSPFGRQTSRWSDIEGFMVAVSGKGSYKRVVFNYSDTYQKYRTVRKVSRGLVGYEAPLDNYGMKAEDLADLLNRWREYHIGTLKTKS